MINSLIKKWALWFPSFEITADKDSIQSWVSSGSKSLSLFTWIIDCFFSWAGFWRVMFSSFFFFFSASACLIIFSVSFGIGLSKGSWSDEVKSKSKSPFETLSPTLTATVLMVPEIFDGISTLDLSLSIVTTGSFIFIWSPCFTRISITSTSSKSPISGTSN